MSLKERFQSTTKNVVDWMAEIQENREDMKAGKLSTAWAVETGSNHWADYLGAVFRDRESAIAWRAYLESECGNWGDEEGDEEDIEYDPANVGYPKVVYSVRRLRYNKDSQRWEVQNPVTQDWQSAYFPSSTRGDQTHEKS